MLSKEAIEEFQEIYRREYGIRLTKAEAEEQALNLLSFYKTIISGTEEESRNEQKDYKHL